MPRGQTKTGRVDHNSMTVDLPCGTIFRGNIKKLLIKQRLHSKVCDICDGVIYDEDYLKNYTSSMGNVTVSAFGNEQKTDMEYRNKQIIDNCQDEVMKIRQKA